MTNEAGEATVLLYPGRYAVMLAKGTVPVRLAYLSVAEDGANRLEILVPRKPSMLRGRVREHGTDKPLSGFLIRVSKKGGTWAVANVRTDAEGRFELVGLPLTRLTLSYMPPDWRTGKYGYVRCNVDFSRQREAQLDLYLPRQGPGVRRPCEIAVTVLCAEDGAPLGGASVYVSAKLGDGLAVMGRGRADERGRFVVRVVEAEQYRIWARAKGHHLAERSVARDAPLMEATVALRRKP